MTVTAICATAGRHTLLERSVGLFLEQVQEKVGEGDFAVTPIYELLIYNNSSVPLTMAEGVMDEVNGFKSIVLINNHIDSETGEPYKNLGAIYRDALTFAGASQYMGEDDDVIVHWDDDDLFMPNHLLEGLRGLIRGKKDAYKPAKSYYRHPGGIQLMANTLEPSIFVKYDHIKKHGYSLTTSDQHLQWVNPLVYEGRIYVDEAGISTLIYNWGDTGIPTFKTSGNAGHEKNFDNYRRFSQDHGDKVITPWERGQLEKYYNLVNG